MTAVTLSRSPPADTFRIPCLRCNGSGRGFPHPITCDYCGGSGSLSISHHVFKPSPSKDGKP